MTKVILTAFRANNTLEQNMTANAALKAEVLALGLTWLTDAIGSYQEEGQPVASKEISMMFDAPSNILAREVIELACTKYKQDCCLLLTRTDAAFLVSVDEAGYMPYDAIGQFEPVTEEKARTCVAYTWINGQYFVCQ